MWQSSWSKGSVTKLCASQQHWSAILCGVSILGTFIAMLLLWFDVWVDALAVYIVSGLMVAVLVSRLGNLLACPKHFDVSVCRPPIRIGPFERTGN